MVATAFDTVTVLSCVGACERNLVITGQGCFVDPGPLLEGESVKVVVAFSICCSCEASTDPKAFRYEDRFMTGFTAVVDLAWRYIGAPLIFGYDDAVKGREEDRAEGFVPIVAVRSLAACYQSGYTFGTLVDGGLVELPLCRIFSFIPLEHGFAVGDKSVVKSWCDCG